MSTWVAALGVFGIGFFVGGSILLGVLLGSWLDTKFNTHLLWVAGLILGIVVAAWGVYQMVLPLMSNKHNKENS
jgi:F0F1-type ATP synthase assembly protein I